MKQIQVYNFEDQLRKTKERLRESDTSNKNKTLMLDFIDDKSAESVTAGRLKKYAFLFQKIGSMLHKDFDKFDDKDLRKLVSKINSNDDWSEWYKADMRSAVKVWFKWLEGDKFTPQKYSWLKTSLPKNVKKSRVEDGETLSIEEVEKLIGGANNTRDKALIATAYETGARPSELLTLRINNIKFDSYGAVVNIQESKTKPRPIRVISAATYLRAWINVHPLRKDSSAPLWLRFSADPIKQEVINIATLNKTLRVIAQRVGIKKRVYSYLLRHSRITHLVQKYPDQIVKKISGHSSVSKHFEVYLHVTNKDVDDAILKDHGLLKSEDDVEKELEKPTMCWQCKTFNSSDAKICEKCNFSLDLSDMAATMAEIKKLTPILSTLTKMSKMSDTDLRKIKLDTRKT